MSRGERKAMITRDAPELSLSRQCRLLSIGRSSFYYAPRGESPSSLALMRRIDELFMKYPFYGSRQMVRQLRRDGVCVGRHRVLQVDAIDRPGGDLSGAENQRAASHAPDLSLSSHRDGYRPAQSGLVRRHHLYPRPAWLSVPRGSDHGLGDAPRFILAAVEHHGRWILRRGLGRRAGPLRPAGDIQYGSGQPVHQPRLHRRAQEREHPHLHGRSGPLHGSYIFIEVRLWRSLKYEAVYLHELTDGFHAERVIGEWIGFYNTERPHSSLDG